MSQEIERKFLVKGEYKSKAYEQSRIVQGYISSARGRTVRVRIRDGKGYLTIKGASNASGTSRYEWEKELQDKKQGGEDMMTKKWIRTSGFLAAAAVMAALTACGGKEETAVESKTEAEAKTEAADKQAGSAQTGDTQEKGDQADDGQAKEGQTADGKTYKVAL